MSAEHGAARRRRGRQVRAWHRHERLTVAMELATALHHSAQRVGGKRPGVLLDPEQVAAATVGHVAARVPLLVVASLSGGDGVDAITVSFWMNCTRCSAYFVIQTVHRTGRRFPWCGAGRACLSSSLSWRRDCSPDHGNSLVACGQGGQCSFFMQAVQVSQGRASGVSTSSWHLQRDAERPR